MSSTNFSQVSQNPPSTSLASRLGDQPPATPPKLGLLGIPQLPSGQARRGIALTATAGGATKCFLGLPARLEPRTAGGCADQDVWRGGVYGSKRGDKSHTSFTLFCPTVRCSLWSDRTMRASGRIESNPTENDAVVLPHPSIHFSCWKDPRCVTASAG